MTIDIPGLPAGAKKLEFILVPGLGGVVKPFLLGRYEIHPGTIRSADAHESQHVQERSKDCPDGDHELAGLQRLCDRLGTILPGELRAKIRFRLPTDEDGALRWVCRRNLTRIPQAKSGKIKKVFPWGTEWPPPTDAGNYGDSTSQKVNRVPLVPGGHDGFADTWLVGRFPPNPVRPL